ncbi:hypothetical protein C1646_757331 [Rhizophagus diaphanus]|nr:hypothetical protein C1646_757331 [Rhizophagus diaphanus] [Rhizophagus sp. MUCL 43196]
MNINNSLPNSFSNNVYESNSQTAATYTPVTYSNNNVSAISDQNNDVISPDHASFNHYQHNVSNNVPNHNYQQQSGISNNDATNPTITSDHNYHHNYQQHMSNVDTNNNVTLSSNNKLRVHTNFTEHDINYNEKLLEIYVLAKLTRCSPNLTGLTLSMQD